MPSFSRQSQKKLMTVRDEIQQVMNQVIYQYDITILEGRRSWERQDELFRQGKSKLRGGQSKHNAPMDRGGNEMGDWLVDAVDVAPYPIDWKDTKRFCYMAGIIMGVARQMNYELRWGGNWDMDQVIIDDQNFIDLPHFEWVGKL